jgi:hypothetical protein
VPGPRRPKAAIVAILLGIKPERSRRSLIMVGALPALRIAPRLPIFGLVFLVVNISRLRSRKQPCEHPSLFVRDVRIGKPSFKDD